ncbi:hypothetical protein ACK4A2_11375 [Aeromonas veronii]
MTIKEFVHTTQLELKDVLDISLKRSHIYEMIAAAYDYSTYASLQAVNRPQFPRHLTALK